MKRFILIPVFVFFLPVWLSSQETSFRFETGLGSYSMQEMKDLLADIDFDFEVKQVSNFPPYLYFRPSLNIAWEQFSLGLEMTFQSTGARISSKDYSGEYRLDMNTQSENLGVILGWNLLNKSKFRVTPELKGGLAFSQLHSSYFLELNDSVNFDNSYKLKSVHFYVEPGLHADYFISPRISAGVYAGYCFDLGDKPFSGEYTLRNYHNYSDVGPDWTGYRFGISIGYILKNKT